MPMSAPVSTRIKVVFIRRLPDDTLTDHRPRHLQPRYASLAESRSAREMDMRRSHAGICGILIAVAGLYALLAGRFPHVAAQAALARLSDGEFWQLIADSSEPSRPFLSDNLVSNEASLQRVIPTLL